MTREARTVLVLGLFGLAGVVVLGMMARRYGAILEAHPGASVAGPVRTDAEAVRCVEAFASVRERLHDEFERSRERPASEIRERLDRERDHALLAVGLEREEYDRIAAMLATWDRDGTPPPAPYLGALSRRRGVLRSLGTGPFD